jgi:hypothetical protein
VVNDLYIRLTDNCFFRDSDNNKVQIKRRKNNVVKKFKIRDGQIEFFNAELEFKMIPKRDKESFEDINVTILVYDEALIFQDIIGNLKVIDSNLEKVDISEITEGDLIATYDGDSYVFEALRDKIVVDNYSPRIKNLSASISEPPPEDDRVEKFSNYVLTSADGIIVNDLLVCV